MALALSRASATLVTSLGSATGTIGVSTASGGTAPYTVAWTSSSGATTIPSPTTLAAKSALLAGKYTVTVTDAVSAVVTQIYDIAFQFAINTTALQQTVSPTPANNNVYGCAVAVDGEYMVVGQSGSTESAKVQAGAAYIYKRTDPSSLTAGWTLQNKVVSDSSTNSSRFGVSVAIEGTTVIVGESNSSPSQTGKVHIFTRTAEVWTRQLTIVPTDGTAGDFFGNTVSLNGDWLAVGAPLWSTKSAPIYSGCGAVYLYMRPTPGAMFTQTFHTRLVTADSTTTARFGLAGISVRGSYVAVANSPSAGGGSAVYAYTLVSNVWQFNVKLQTPAPLSNHFGSIDSDTNTMAVGCTDYSGSAGAVYMYKYSSNLWTFDSLLPSFQSSCSLGCSVSMHGSTLVAGMLGYSSLTGGVALYKLVGSQWILRGIFVATLSGSPQQGNSVCLSPTGKYMFWGASQYTTGQGAAITWTADPADVSVTVTSNVNVAGQSTGSISSSISGGGQSLTTSWSSSPTYSGSSTAPPTDVSTVSTATAGNLAFGLYKANYTDGVSGLVYSASANILQLSVYPGSFVYSTAGNPTTLAATTVAGGSGSFTVQWTSSGTGATVFSGAAATNLTSRSVVPGSYTVTVTDSVYPTSVAAYTYIVPSLTFIASDSSALLKQSPAAFDSFGAYATMDGQIMAATRQFNNTAYIYERTGTTASGTWAPTVGITTPGSFAKAVSLSGITLLCGAPESGAPANSGLVYVYKRVSVSVWNLEATLTPSDATAGYFFGKSVSIDGDTAVVGSPSWGPTAAGKVYVYKRTGTSWALSASFTGSNAAANFGTSVSVRGTRFLVGAPGQILSPIYGAAGAAYCYDLVSSTWTLTGQLAANDPSPGDQFGTAVSVVGDKAIVGAPGWQYKNSASYFFSTGAAYIIELSGSTWTVVQSSMMSGQVNNALYGSVVSGNSNGLLAAGAGPASATYGAAYTFLKPSSGGGWKALNSYSSTGTAGKYFGSAVALSPKYMVTGAYNDTISLTSQGALYTSMANNVLIASTIVHVGAFNSATGSIVVSASGGYAPYTYVWTSTTAPTDTSSIAATDVSAQTASTITSLTRGSYTVTITDSTAQVATATYAVTQLMITPGSMSISGTGATSAILATVCTGGSGVYTVQWTSGPGATTLATPTTLAGKPNLLPGVYTVTATDTARSDSVATYTYTVPQYTNFTVPSAVVPAGLRVTGTVAFNAIAQSGLRVVAGTYYYNSNVGIVYVFKKDSYNSTAAYQYEATITATTPGSPYYFGTAVAIDGTSLIISEVGSTSNGYLNFYEFQTGVWTKQQQLTASDATSGLSLGTCVHMSGDYAIAGSKNQKAYVFQRTSGVWAQTQILLSLDTPGNTYFGYRPQCVAITPSYLCVGSSAAQVAGVATGMVYVFKNNAGTWQLDARLQRTFTAAGDQFGYSVSIAGTTVVAGAPTYSSIVPVVANVGAAYVFDRSSSTGLWTQTAVLVCPVFSTPKTAGLSVAITPDGKYVATSGNAFTTTARFANVFSNQTGTWVPVQYMTATGYDTSDGFANEVACGATDIFVTAPGWRPDATIANVGCGYSYQPNPVVITPGAMTTTNNFGLAIGAITQAVITGGTAPYTLSWSSTGTDVSANTTAGPLANLARGTYTLTVTDSIGQITSYAYVLPTCSFGLNAGVVTHPSTPGTATGSISLASPSTGIFAPYTYTWSTNLAVNVRNPTVLEAKTALPAGRYTIMVTNNKGGTYTVSYTLLDQTTALPSAFVSDTSAASSNFYATPSSVMVGSLFAVGYKIGNTVKTYRLAAGVWSLSQTITGPGGQNLGAATAISSDGLYMAVTDSKSPGATGSVNVYYAAASTFTLISNLSPSDPQTYTSNFGNALAINNKRMVVAQRLWDQNYGTGSVITDCGSLYLYDRGVAANAAWTFTGKLQSPVPVYNENFGSSVVLTNDTLVVGASAFQTTGGSIYVYYDAAGTGAYALQAHLQASSLDYFLTAAFGEFVAFDGNNILALYSSNAVPGASSGGADIYTRTGAAWAKTATLPFNYTASEAAGLCYAIKGNRAVLSSNLKVSCYELANGAWTLYAEIKSPNTGTYAFGLVLGLSDQSLIVGATTTSNQNVFLYSLPPRAMVLKATRQQIIAPATTGSITNMSVTGGSGSYVSYSWAGSTGTSVTQTTLADLPALAAGTYQVTITDSLGYALTIVVATLVSSSQLVYSPGTITHPSSSVASDGSIAASTVTGGTSVYTTVWSATAGSTVFPYWEPVQPGQSSLLSGVYSATVSDASYSNLKATVLYELSGGTVSLPASILAADPAASDYLSVVAVSGLLMTVGAWNKTQTQAGAGAVYFFKRSGYGGSDTWSANGKVTSDVTGTNFNFGKCVAMDGVTAVVGEPNGSLTPGSTAKQGRVHVYVYNGTSWSVQQRLVCSTYAASADTFGTSVDISGERLAAGAPASGNVGAVFVFNRTGSTWSESAIVRINTSAGFAAFGNSVSLDGDVLVEAYHSHGAQVSTWSGTAWAFTALLTAPDFASTQQYYTAKVSGNTIACANFFAQASNGFGSQQGFIDIFQYSNGSWSSTALQRLQSFDSKSNYYFGQFMALKGNVLLAAISTPSGNNFLSRYVYNGTRFALQTRYLASDVGGSGMGETVAVTNDFIAAGGKYYKGAFTSQGAVYTTTHNGLAIVPGAVSVGAIAAATVTGGTAPYTYAWTSTGTNVSGITTAGPLSRLAVGNYTLTVTDALARTAGYTYSVVAPFVAVALTIIPATVVNVAIYGQSTGSIGATTFQDGTAPFTYSWTVSNGGSAVPRSTVNDAKTGLSAGSYTFNVVDVNGYQGTYTYVLTQNPVLVIGGGAVLNTSTPATSDGSIGATTVTGGSGVYASYAWTNSGTGSSTISTGTTLVAKTGLAAGSYTLLATDNVGGTLSRTFVVAQNAALSYTGGAVTPVLIYGQATGQISAVTAAGGSGVYTYSWSSSSGATTITTPTTAAAKTALKAGTYTLVLTDDRLVTATYSYAVPQNPIIAYSGGAVVSSTGSNGSISAVTVTGGSGVFVSYAWTNSAGGTSISTQNLTAKNGLAAATYNLAVTDSVGGVGNFTFVVGVTPPIVLVTGSVTHCTVFNTATGAVSASTATGGLGLLTYVWTSSLGATDLSAVTTGGPLPNVKAGTYQLAVTDLQGTVAYASFIVGQPIYAVAAFTNQTRTEDGSAAIAALGGLGAYSYAWTLGGNYYASTASALTGLAVGVYECTVTTSLFSTVVEVVIATYMTMQAAPTVVRASWNAIPNASGYRVEYRNELDTDYTLFTSKTLSTFAVISSLAPQVLYRVRVFATVGASTRYIKYYSDTATTPASVAANYSKQSLQVGTKYDLVPVQNDAAVNPDAVVDGLFTAGDPVSFNTTVKSARRVLDGVVARKNFAYQIQKSIVLYIPFDATDTGSLQQAQLTLLDGSSKSVVFQATTNSILLDGTSYVAGDVLYIGGQKVTVAKGTTSTAFLP
jgi:hypothetical protein